MPTESAAAGVPRVVVDTNLLVGHLFHPSARGPAELMERWRRGEVRVCVSGAILREVRATLRRLPVPERRKREILELLRNPRLTERVEGVCDSGWRCADPRDDKFLHLAMAAGAEVLITSDRALLEVEGFPVPILKSGQWGRAGGR